MVADPPLHGFEGRFDRRIFMHMAWEGESWKLLAAANLVATRSHSPSRHAPEFVTSISSSDQQPCGG